jgi:PAS domain S-box-containing protein
VQPDSSQHLAKDTEARRLSALASYGLLDTPAERPFDDLAHLAARLCGTPIALVTLVDEQRQWFKSVVGLDLRETPRDIAFCAHTIDSPDLFEVPDAAAAPEFAANPLVTGPHRLRFYAGVPLTVEGGHALGSLAVLDRVPRRLTEQQRQDLWILAGQVVMLLEERRQRRLAQVATLDARRQAASLLAIAGHVAQLGAWELDLDQQHVVWSDVVADIHGMPRGFSPQVDEALAFYMEPDRSVLARSVALCRETGQPFDHELVLQPRNRPPRWVRSIGEAVRAADGRITHLRGACQDITERKSQLVQMERLAERLAGTLEAIPDPFLTFGPDGRVQLANASFIDLMQRPRHEVVDRDLAEVLQGSAFDATLLQRCHEAMRSGHAAEFETVDAQGRRFEVGCFQAADGVAVHARDITQREATLSRLRLLDTCIRRLNDAVLITDAQADAPGPAIVFANAAVETMSGWRLQDLIGDTPRKLQGPLTQRDRLAQLREAVRHCRPLETELINHRRSGEPYWVELKLSPIHDDAGRCTHFVAVGRDITERKQAEAHREALESQLRQAQKMESIGTLAGGIAHDFNNILGSVLGSLTLVRDALPQDSPARQPLAAIEAAALRARVLVQQILTFGRQHAAKRERQPLQPLIEETWRMLRSTLPGHVSLRVLRPAVDIWAEVDANQLQQVLLNLCTNAWHALPASGGRIELGLDSAPPAPGQWETAEPRLGDAWAHLWVRDDGCGMAPDVLSRAFEPFFTTKAVGQGTGLGLSVAHGIVASHGGVISADSMLGRGATFHIHLPRCQVPDEARPVPLPQAAGRAPGDLADVCVLCVDDDPVMLMTMQALLERQGCRVLPAASAIDALARLRDAPSAADVLVTDYNMPHIDGLSLIAATREIRSGLPIVLASGFIDAVVRERARSLGVRSLVQKERISEDLVEAVRVALSTSA